MKRTWPVAFRSYSCGLNYQEVIRRQRRMVRQRRYHDLMARCTAVVIINQLPRRLVVYEVVVRVCCMCPYSQEIGGQRARRSELREHRVVEQDRILRRIV